MNPNAPPFVPPAHSHYPPMQQQQQQSQHSQYMPQQQQEVYHPHHQMPNNFYQDPYHHHHHQQSYGMGMPPQSMGMPGMIAPHMMSAPQPVPPTSATTTTLANGCETGGSQNQNQVLSDQLLHRMYNHPNCTAMFEVQIGLEQLIYESHEYETWANAIRERITGPDISDNDMALAVDIMIEMAVNVNNAQYNFSRLCQFLDNNIRSFAMSIMVPQLLEFSNHHQEYDFFSPEHRQNFLLFLAELYEKIEVNGMRLSQLSSLISDQVSILLKCDPFDSSVKTVIKVMKLIGRYLESDQGPTPVNSIFSVLDDICYNSKDLSESVRGQVLALHQLRENKWGISSEQSTSAAATAATAGNTSSLLTNGNSSQVPIVNDFIIGPDGKPLSEEEYAFLEESCAPFGASNSPSESFAEAIDDDEVLEDYEKFLQATAIRAAEKALEKLSFEEDDIDSVVSSASGGDATRNLTAHARPNSNQHQNSDPNPTLLTIVRKEKRT